MPRYRLLIEYDGSAFHGWQIQPNHVTVQEAIESALATALRQPTSIVGSGRTDAGVHARGQVAHFSSPSAVDTFRLLGSLNGLLPKPIAILGITHVPDAFHARFDATRRRYHYYVSTVPRALERTTRWYLRPAPDFALMNEAAQQLIGTHNFDAFCRARSETKNRVCTLRFAQWLPDTHSNDWYFAVEGDRFLHGMVRALVGTLVQIGRGQRPPNDLPRIVASQDRRQAGPAAPARGLVLEQVGYE